MPTEHVDVRDGAGVRLQIGMLVGLLVWGPVIALVDVLLGTSLLGLPLFFFATVLVVWLVEQLPYQPRATRDPRPARGARRRGRAARGW